MMLFFHLVQDLPPLECIPYKISGTQRGVNRDGRVSFYCPIWPSLCVCHLYMVTVRAVTSYGLSCLKILFFINDGTKEYIQLESFNLYHYMTPRRQGLVEKFIEVNFLVMRFTQYSASIFAFLVFLVFSWIKLHIIFFG